MMTRLIPLGLVCGLSFFCSTALFAKSNASGKSPAVQSPMENMAETLKKAKDCIPSVRAGAYSFCTGFTVTKAEVSKLWHKHTHLCESNIQKMGYKITMDNHEGAINASDWVDFITGTQPSMTFHREKVVAFKKTDITTCMHEWLHVKQGTLSKEPVLAVKKRQAQIKKVDAFIDAGIAGVEKLEMAGKHKEALESADKLQPVINELNKVKDLAQSLDEIEAHFFIYQECKTRNCTAEEKKLILTDLFNRKDHLPEQFRKEIVDKMHKVSPERTVQAAETGQSIAAPAQPPSRGEQR